jgi:hypothetical protein
MLKMFKQDGSMHNMVVTILKRDITNIYGSKNFEFVIRRRDLTNYLADYTEYSPMTDLKNRLDYYAQKAAVINNLY